MMDKMEFINNVIGLPWVNRAASFESVDCWGLVILYYKHVLSINLPMVEGYDIGDNISECWQRESANSHWHEVDTPESESLVFTCYDTSGKPAHVGIYIGGGMVLHAHGNEVIGGSVKAHKIKVIERMYGNLTFHKYVG